MDFCVRKNNLHGGYFIACTHQHRSNPYAVWGYCRLTYPLEFKTEQEAQAKVDMLRRIYRSDERSA